MGLEKVLGWIIGIALAASATGNLPALQRWILEEQNKVLSSARTSTWGSPRFFPNRNFVEKTGR